MRNHNQYEIQNLLQEWQKPVKALLNTAQKVKDDSTWQLCHKININGFRK